MPDPRWLEVIEREIERRERVDACEHDFTAFCETYFGASARMADKTPTFHQELRDLATKPDLFDDWYFTNPTTGKKRKKKGLVLAAPRGHAKTMVLTFMLTMWWILYRKKNFIILVGNSARAAAENVTDIRDELVSNDLIKRDFGDLCGADLGYRWAQADFVAVHRCPVTGQVEHTVRVTAKSPGAQVRGIKHMGMRPDGAVVDDLENDEAVRNSETIQKVSDWLNKALLPALDPRRSDFIMIGTILHFDSVLARMLSPKFSDVYVQRVYRAYWEEDGARKYLWPERFTPEALEMEKRRLGTLAFNSEFLNNPVDPDTRRFRPEWIRWYTGDDLSYEDGEWYFQGRHLEIIQGVDPAIKEKEQDNNDFFAHVTIGVTEESDVTKRAIVVLYPFKDRMDFPQQVQRVIQQANTYPQVRDIGIESVAYQGALRQQLLLKELLPIREIRRDRGKSDKKARITASGVFFENGQVFLRAADASEAGEMDELQLVRVHHQHQALYEDLMRYPLIAHDDLLDALETCIALAKRSTAGDDFDPASLTKQPLRTSAFGEVGDLTGEPPFLAEIYGKGAFVTAEERLQDWWG